MPYKQHDALSRNPNQLNMVQVASYERCIKANITRVWENVLDWEHLPWLHDASFDFVALDEAGDWGWRTFSNRDKTGHVELCINRKASEYVARSYEQGQQVSEIWTSLTADGEHTHIRVTFDLPGIPADRVEKLGKLFLNLYTRLWDEDEAMMQQRQKRLDQKFKQVEDTEIRLERPLSLPQTISLGRGEWTLRNINDRLVIHSAICPHLLGPLDDSIAVDNNLVRCPWHGYQFDIDTGKCITPERATCQLKTPPVLTEHADYITLTLNN